LASAETLKKQSKGKPGVQEVKFFNINLHLRSSGSIYVKKFALLTVSGLSVCFVFRGFFAKKKQFVVFSFN